MTLIIKGATKAREYISEQEAMTALRAVFVKAVDDGNKVLGSIKYVEPDSSYIYMDGEQKNYAKLEAEHTALKEEVAELRRIVDDHLSKGADFGHGGL